MIQFKSGDDILELRGPVFNDSIAVVGGATIKRSRDGQYVAYKNVSPGVRQFTLDFNQLDRSSVLTAFDFFKNHKLEDLIYVDPDGINWRGRITAQSFVTTQDGRNSSSLPVTFEGKRVETN